MQPDKSHVARWYERLSGCHYLKVPTVDLSHLNVVLVG